MSKRLPLIALLALPAALAGALALSSSASAQRVAAPVAPTADQAGAARYVYGFLSDSRYAYRPQALDDALSQQILERFLDGLDGERLFFTAADVAEFEADYATTLDDAIRGPGASALAPPYVMFERYRQRVAERVAHARGLLAAGFDLSVDETWTIDAEERPWAPDAAALDETWRKYVKNDWLRLVLAGKEEADIRRTLDRRYAQIERRIGELKGEDIFQTFMNAYAGAIDPHTSYMNPRTAENFNNSMANSLEGIGAVLQRQEDFVVIREIVPGGPAAMSGRLQVGDRISAVGQADGPMQDVVGWPIDEVVQLIRGDKGTEVRLDVIPVDAGIDGPHQVVTLERDRIRLEEAAAKASVIEVGERRIGVIELPTFYQDFEARRRNDADYVSATRDVQRLLEGFRADGVDGVVLDLRNNGGGSLDEARQLTGLFIDQGPVVQVRQAGGRIGVEADQAKGVAWEGPLAVLVNRGSASASEIFAGAIQDYGRGLVIGETTFGKGTVQNLVDLDNFGRGSEPRFGQLKLTVAQFFRISGASTQHRGVVPDVAFPASFGAEEFGESTYDNALPFAQVPKAQYRPLGNFQALLPALRERHEARAAEDREMQWLVEDLARFEAERARGEISLNLEVRRAERDANLARRAERQAERIALGLDPDPLAAETDDGLQGDERDIRTDVALEEAAEQRPDPLLREAAAVLVDAVDALGGDQQLAARVLPPGLAAGAWVR